MPDSQGTGWTGYTVVIVGPGRSLEQAAPLEEDDGPLGEGNKENMNQAMECVDSIQKLIGRRFPKK